MRGLALAAGLAALPLIFGGVGQSFACAGDKVLLEGDFSFADDAWGVANKNFAMKDGSVTLKPEINSSFFAMNNAFLFDDADICVTVTAVDIPQPKETRAGVVFWAKDVDNLFELKLTTDGYFRISRMVAGAWMNPNPFEWTLSDAIVQGINKPNKLGVTTKGQTLTVTINGKAVVTLPKAQAPEPPSLIGLEAESGAQTDTWKFTDLKVTNVK